MTTLNLELSKELWEKGVKLETEKWWCRDETEHPVGSINWRIMMGCKEHHAPWMTYIPVPSTDELLEILPPIKLEIWRVDKMPNQYHVFYGREFYNELNASEALAKMVIYLLDIGYTFNPAKKRLER